MLRWLAHKLISRAEVRLGVPLEYTHAIADADIGLLTRYNKLFGFLDPNRHVPVDAYHTARLIGALSADCGTCVEAEINLAKSAGMDLPLIKSVLADDNLPAPLDAVARLSRAVTSDRLDDAPAREMIRSAYGDKGLIELSFAMNGAALLPGIKRAMGHATTCDLGLLRELG